METMIIKINKMYKIVAHFYFNKHLVKFFKSISTYLFRIKRTVTLVKNSKHKNPIEHITIFC